MTRDLSSRMGTFISERGPSTCSEIASGVRARYIDVLNELQAGAFLEAAAPEHGSPRATYWTAAPVPSQPLPVSRADRLYSVLADGRPHSRQEVFERVGFMLTNNAASELRARGVEVEHRIVRKVHVYQLTEAA